MFDELFDDIAVEKGNSRLCGKRIQSGIYLACGLSPWGKSWDNFILCPPVLPPEELLVPDRGQVIHQSGDGTYHVYDRVGRPYVNVTDFLQEAFLAGTSRHVSPYLQFNLLTPGSQQRFLHPRAFVQNWREYGDHIHECPRERPEHMDAQLDEFCSKIWWNDLDKSTVSQVRDHLDNRYCKRNLANDRYYFGRTTPVLVMPAYQEAIFCWLPITRIEVIAGGDKTDVNYKLAKASNLPVEIVDE